MSIIYTPRGRAREYSPLALNLYTGCEHGCKYCYAAGVLRKSREQFTQDVQPRKDILKHLERQVKRQAPDDRRVLLSFTHDPYTPCEAEHGVTRRALEILGKHGYRATILTKNGELAMRDFDLMREYDTEYGVTLCWYSDTGRAEWEPGAGTVQERFTSLNTAYARRIKTWVSIEPVIVPSEALQVIELLRDQVDMIKLGKLNHHKDIEAGIDWAKFLADALVELKKGTAAYYIKKDLQKYCKTGTEKED